MGAETQRAAEPLALIAAILAGGMAVVYVWVIRLQGNQPIPWFLIALLTVALLAHTEHSAERRTGAQRCWPPPPR